MSREHFEELYKVAKDKTVMPKARLYELYRLASHAINNTSGHIAECGVYKGGSAYILKKLLDRSDIIGKKLFLLDTYEGMPKVDENVDHHKEGDFADTSLEAVREFIGLDRNLFYLQGEFKESLLNLIENFEEKSCTTYCFAHLDGDLYSSITECLNFFYPRMERGGIILIDDYEGNSCPGVKPAVMDFMKHRPEYIFKLQYKHCAIQKC